MDTQYDTLGSASQKYAEALVEFYATELHYNKNVSHQNNVALSKARDTMYNAQMNLDYVAQREASKGWAA